VYRLLSISFLGVFTALICSAATIDWLQIPEFRTINAHNGIEQLAEVTLSDIEAPTLHSEFDSVSGPWDLQRLLTERSSAAIVAQETTVPEPLFTALIGCGLAGFALALRHSSRR
jgi:hypothetical protein